MKEYWAQGSYTVEAAIYIPIIIFLLFGSVGLAIDYLQESKKKEISQNIQNLEIVQEFYGYQIWEEIREELDKDET